MDLAPRPRFGLREQLRPGPGAHRLPPSTRDRRRGSTRPLRECWARARAPISGRRSGDHRI
ncbi:hypothetical protein T492DRAFT_970718 [Pavlovales sp. CCMP2436]|nr:hypothetical protein T492DRAFT_970718 [Pavlovales sp. CCMP2436]